MLEFKSALGHTNMNLVGAPILEGFRRFINEGVSSITEVPRQIFPSFGSGHRHDELFAIVNLNGYRLPGRK